MTLVPPNPEYQFIQDTEPSNAKKSDWWLDTSVAPPKSKVYDGSGFVEPQSVDFVDDRVSNAGATQSDIVSGVDSSNLADEITSGRTRELLMLLQDKPVPEVQDPLNIQSALSEKYATGTDGDFDLGYLLGEVVSRPSDEFDISQPPMGVIINPNINLFGVELTISQNTASGTSEFQLQTGDGSTTLETETFDISPGDTIRFIHELQSGTDYRVVITPSGQYSVGRTNSFSSISGTDIDYVNAVRGGDRDDFYHLLFSDITPIASKALSGYVTDRFAAPTSEPADFQQWNAIQTRDVTTGGSTSVNPVEFEILDSTDTALNSSRIPKARIADEPFTMRNRVYSESATSDGQSDYQIATTGDGGHFGIPILTVVSVKQNGSVLDSANWSFDDVDTVTIDTSNVTIASGDTIDIKYDFDVFDSTLQPRAYLSRESTSETSPSISHFRYEYVI